jgi:hypothetical protein
VTGSGRLMLSSVYKVLNSSNLLSSSFLKIDSAGRRLLHIHTLRWTKLMRFHWKLFLTTVHKKKAVTEARLLSLIQETLATIKGSTHRWQASLWLNVRTKLMITNKNLLIKPTAVSPRKLKVVVKIST